MSRKTVRKYIKEFEDKLQKLGDESNEKKKISGKSKQVMKKVDIHKLLIQKGYDIGYTTVCNYIRRTLGRNII